MWNSEIQGGSVLREIQGGSVLREIQGGSVLREIVKYKEGVFYVK